MARSVSPLVRGTSPKPVMVPATRPQAAPREWWV